MTPSAAPQLELEPLVSPDREPASPLHLDKAASALPSQQESFDTQLFLAYISILIAGCGVAVYFWWQALVADNLLVATDSIDTPSGRTVTHAPAAPSPTSAVPPVPEKGFPSVTPTLVVPKPFAPTAASIEPPPSTAPLFRRTTATRQTHPLLEQAFQAFNNGAYDRAEVAWDAYLRTDPRSADALHGLAAIALSRGESGHAADYFRRALAANPKDAIAYSGLLMLAPEQDESRLKTLIAEQPDAPHPHFALGNLHAADARWAEAQQAYFLAHVAAPANPDYLFNLAVSLDHLRQHRQAAHYYGLALDAASLLPASFDKDQAMARRQLLPP